MVEIVHGNGLTTRYAHMSAFRAKVDEVDAGDIVGLIGSTGRSAPAFRGARQRPRRQSPPMLEASARGREAQQAGA